MQRKKNVQHFNHFGDTINFSYLLLITGSKLHSLLCLFSKTPKMVFVEASLIFLNSLGYNIFILVLCSCCSFLASFNSWEPRFPKTDLCVLSDTYWLQGGATWVQGSSLCSQPPDKSLSVLVGLSLCVPHLNWAGGSPSVPLWPFSLLHFAFQRS